MSITDGYNTLESTATKFYLTLQTTTKVVIKATKFERVKFDTVSLKTRRQIVFNLWMCETIYRLQIGIFATVWCRSREVLRNRAKRKFANMTNIWNVFFSTKPLEIKYTTYNLPNAIKLSTIVSSVAIYISNSSRKLNWQKCCFIEKRLVIFYHDPHFGRCVFFRSTQIDSHASYSHFAMM